MSKAWNDHDATKKGEVLAAVAKIYKDAGYPKGLEEPSKTDEYVNILMANQKQEQKRGLSISGKFSADQEELVSSLKEKLQDALKDVSDAKVSLACQRNVGDKMGDIKNVSKVFEAGNTDIVHKQGEVLLLDFWATWCPPCQQPMAHNQKMLEEHGDKWGGKVRLIGLSIDNAAETVKKHVETKGWQKVEHYHARNGTCTGDKDFGVSGVPHVCIVDTNGVIVFIGHPANRSDLVQDFDDLLAGKKITGKGCEAPGGGDGDAEEKFEGNVQEDQADKVVAKFLELSTAHCNTEATKEAASGMPRAFCVLVHEQKFDCKTNKMVHKMENIHVLVGTKEKIEGMKAILKPFHLAEGEGWKTIVREQET